MFFFSGLLPILLHGFCAALSGYGIAEGKPVWVAVGLALEAVLALLMATMLGRASDAVSEDFYRPTDVVNLWGDPTKAKAKLKWNPNKTSFEELVKLMVEHDIAKVAAEGAAAKVRTNLAEYLEKGIVK